MTAKNPIILGIDPGTTHHGWCALRATPVAIEYLASGHEKGEGDAVTQRLLASLSKVHGVAIETPTIVFLRQAMKPVMQVARQSGLIVATVRRHNPLPFVFEANANQARRRMVGNGSPSDAMVKDYVLSHVEGWPRRSNSHERDAAVIALDAIRNLRATPADLAARRTAEVIDLAGHRRKPRPAKVAALWPAARSIAT